MCLYFNAPQITSPGLLQFLFAFFAQRTARYAPPFFNQNNLNALFFISVLIEFDFRGRGMCSAITTPSIFIKRGSHVNVSMETISTCLTELGIHFRLICIPLSRPYQFYIRLMAAQERYVNAARPRSALQNAKRLGTFKKILHPENTRIDR